MTGQAVLDLFGVEDRRSAFLARHQIGQLRLPWDTQGGGKAGELAPAWVCCHCHTVELSEYLLWINHGCNEIDRRDTPCRHSKPQTTFFGLVLALDPGSPQ